MGGIGEKLVNAGESADIVVSTLIKALNDESKDVRRNAADELGDMGASSPAVIEALTKALNDESKSVRREVAQTLEKIETPE